MDPKTNWNVTRLLEQHHRPKGAKQGETTGDVEVRPYDPENYKRERQKDDERISRLIKGR